MLGNGAVFLDLSCRLVSSWGFLEVPDSAEPVRYPVPTRAVLVHHLQVVDFKRL